MSTSKASSSSGSNQQSSQPTVVALYDCEDLTAHHCGYCNKDGNISVGMSSELMQIKDYQLLIDRGWRRSGTYLYKPCMDKTCCPLYTIKNDAMNFEMTRSQKQTLKLNRKFLDKNIKPGQGSKASTETDSIKKFKKEDSAENNAATTSKIADMEQNKMDIVEVKACAECLKQKENTNAMKVIKYALEATDSEGSTPINELINVPKLKSKHKRLYRKLKLLKTKNLISQPTDIMKYLKVRKNKPCSSHDSDSLESYLKPGVVTMANQLELTLVRSWPPSKQFQDTLKEEHELYSKYQTQIHNDSPLECSMKQFQRFLCTSPLMPLSHKGPLQQTNGKVGPHLAELEGIGYGSFHQQYRLNGQLIAVGVLDILDKCVSSVYFFYDPAFSFMNLGTYSALREIELTRRLHQLDPQIEWYYLGFYTHECRKMRYKGAFKPSFLLDPEVYSWHPIETCVPMLEASKYSRFADPSATDTNQQGEDVSQIKIRVKFAMSEMRLFKFSEFCQFLNESFVPQFTSLVRGYSKLFGREFSNNVLIRF